MNLRIKKLERKAKRIFSKFGEVSEVVLTWQEAEYLTPIFDKEQVCGLCFYIELGRDNDSFFVPDYVILNKEFCGKFSKNLNSETKELALKIMNSKELKKLFVEARNFEEELAFCHRFLSLF